MIRTDYAVIGHSLAGISAALALAKSGDRVVLLDFHRDTDAVAESPRIQPTSLGPPATGAAFDAAMENVLAQAGVRREPGCIVESVFPSGSEVFVECSDRGWLAKGVVFAPNGTEPGIDVEGSAALQGFGLSYSAAADAPFFPSRRVAVYGDAPRVLDHAWIAARYASEVVVLLKGTLSGSPMELSATFHEGVALRSLQAGNDGLLKAIELDAADGRRSVEVAALFIAQHVVPAMDVVRGDSENIAFAGLAAGIDYWKHAELVNDGARAARTLQLHPEETK